MNLEQLCNQFDGHFIAEKQNMLDNTYLSSSDHIFSDGTYKKNIDSDGYIKISDVKDANYIMYIDAEGNLFLSIYQYTPEMKFKEIIDHLNIIRKETGMHRHSLHDMHQPNSVVHNPYNVVSPLADGIHLSGFLVDINDFKCGECNNKMAFSKAKSKDEKTPSTTIFAKCVKCGIEYTLVPSKYYVIKSKKRSYTDKDDLLDESIFDQK